MGIKLMKARLLCGSLPYHIETNNPQCILILGSFSLLIQFSPDSFIPFLFLYLSKSTQFFFCSLKELLNFIAANFFCLLCYNGCIRLAFHHWRIERNAHLPACCSIATWIVIGCNGQIRIFENGWNCNHEYHEKVAENERWFTWLAHAKVSFAIPNGVDA